MKNHIKKWIIFFFKCIYKQYTPTNQSIKWLMQTFFFQKILRINGRVPWPVHFTSYVIGHEKIKSETELIGEGIKNYIDGRNGIIIKENVWLGPNVSIISQNHHENNFNLYIEGKPIIIHKNCLLLSNCTILPEVELGEHTIVAAGAIVTKSFLEGNQIIGGIPAKIIKKIDFYNPN